MAAGARLVFEIGAQAGEVVALEDQSLILGRESSSADVVIDDPQVSRAHARIFSQGSGYLVEDLGSTNGTFVNDRRIDSPQRLGGGDRIRLGKEVVVRLEVTDAAPVTSSTSEAQARLSDRRTIRKPPPDEEGDGETSRARGEEPSPESARLIVGTPDGREHEYVLEDDRITLGRLGENDIVLNVPIVSRRHLSLRRRENSYILAVRPDALNSVLVNQEPVLDQIALSDGDEISIGSVDGDFSVIMHYRGPGAGSPDRPASAPTVQSASPDATLLRASSQDVASGGGEMAQTVIGESDVPSDDVPPQLVVTAYGQESVLHSLDQDRIRIGRHPDNDIVLDNRYVSRFHAELERRGAHFYVVPSPEAGNPLVLDGEPVMEPTRLRHGAKMRIGGFDPIEMISLVYLSPAQEVRERRDRVIRFSESKVMSLGRHPDNEIVLEAPTVSRFHAQIERIGKRYRVRDLDSSNGTFVDGEQIRGDVWVTPGSAIHIGPYRLVVGHEQLAQIDESEGGMAVEAYHLNKWVRDDLNILQDVSLSFQPREFIVVVGQSGGGKSTLVDALSGYRPATHGQVIVNTSIDVYKNFDAIRNTIGYVPQKDIIHMQLSVFEALDYSARLRMPADTTQEERHRRIEEVLEELDLAHRRDTQVSELSGGQQKRVSIGVELLNKPGLFFLDEPTSGLDPGMETELMQLMRRLADQGRTIVLITHATKNVMLADKVVFLARGGYLAWFGPPEGALDYFDQYRSERDRRTKPIEFDDIYNLLDHEELGSGEDWADRFRQHEAYGQYIPTAADEPSDQPGVMERAAQGVQSVRRGVSALRQFMILSARSLRILARDRATLGLMLLAAPLMASLDFILAFGVGRDLYSFQSGDLNKIIITLTLLMNTSILVGGLSVMRELVREREIYKRERMVGLNLPAYLFSKLWFALIVALYQSFWFTLARHVAFEMPGGPGEVLFFFITVFLLVTAGMMMGLLSSAMAPNANALPMILVMFILPQAVLSGALVPLPDFLSAPANSRWAFQGTLAISGVGSDVIGDACWSDMTSEERDDLSREFKDQNCDCMGVNSLRQASCSFPGLGQYYVTAIDAEDPPEPQEPGPQPELPEFPEEPARPDDFNDPEAVQAYLDDLETYNQEVERRFEEFERELQEFEEAQDDYRDELEGYQEELEELESDRLSAIGSAESTIELYYDDYSWTFVDQSDRQAYLGMLLKTWGAQLALIAIGFLGVFLLQRRRDVR